MRKQGTTDEDIASTRVARSVLFFATMCFFSIITVTRVNSDPIWMQRYFGALISILTICIITVSSLGVRITSVFRTFSFLAMANLLVVVIVLNAVKLHWQAAALLAYPTGTCWIETWLAYRVMRRGRD